MALCADFVQEACAATGTADYTLTGPPANTPYVSFVRAFTTGAKVFYVVQSDTSYKWEIGWGIVTDASPDTLTRNVIASWDLATLSTSAKISWGGSDGALRAYCAPIAGAMLGALTFHRGTTVPAYPIPGMIWMDTTTITAVVFKVYDAGGDWITLPWVINETANTVTLSAAGITSTGTVTMTGAAINEASGSDIASASSIDIGAATGNLVSITGTTTITALGTVQAGVQRTLIFAGALTLTHNGTSLILPGAANILTDAGDTAIFRSLGSGNWRCVAYQRIDGGPVVGWRTFDKGAFSSQATYTKDAIPAWANRLRLTIDAVPANDGVQLDAIFRKSSGTDITSYNTGFMAESAGANGAGAADSQSTCAIVGSVQNDASSGGVFAVIEVEDIQNARYKRGKITVTSLESAGGIAVLVRGFEIKDTAAITGVKALFATGNIASGRYKLELEA